MQRLTYIWHFYYLQIISAFVIFGGLISLSIYKSDWHHNIDWLEAIAGVGTLLFAFFLWLNNVSKEWENNLDKRLTAYFKYESRDVIVFRNILLFNESDMRAWSQQIARQKADGDIKFEPFFRYRDRGVEYTKTGKPMKSYEITFYLSAIPEKLKPRLGYHGDETKKKWCIEWHQVENEDGSISMDEILVPGNPKM